HHGFLGDQVFHGEIFARCLDFRTTVVAVFLAHRIQLVANHLHQFFRVGQDGAELADFFQQVLVIEHQLFLLETGQLLQAQVEDRLGLVRRQEILAVTHAELGIKPVRTAGIDAAGAIEHGGHRTRCPATGNQFFLRLGTARRLLDQLDHRIDIRQRHRQAFEHMAFLARLAQLIHSATGYHFAAVTDKRLKHLLEIQRFRLAIDERDHVDTEHVFHLRLAVQVVQHHFRHFTLTQLNDDAHAVLVGLITQLGNTLDLLFLDQLGDLLDQACLVHLVRNFGNDDGLLATTLHVLDLGAGTGIDATTAGAIGLHDTGTAIDDAGGGEIRALDVVHQFINGQLAVLDQRQAAIDDFAQVVRRNIGGHADGDTGGTVNQQVRYPRRHDFGDLFGAVVVRHIIDGFLVEIGQQVMGNLRHTHFGVSHRCSAVAGDGAEVALAINQHVAQRERLRHTHDGVVHRRVAVRMVFTDHVTDDTGRFLVGLVPVVAKLMHGKQDATVYRLEAVPYIRQCPADDHAHGVIEIGLFQFVFDIDRGDFFGEIRHVLVLSPADCLPG